jgi:hypothetical protein
LNVGGDLSDEGSVEEVVLGLRQPFGGKRSIDFQQGTIFQMSSNKR